jgi:hypothetical protein
MQTIHQIIRLKRTLNFLCILTAVTILSSCGTGDNRHSNKITIEVSNTSALNLNDAVISVSDSAQTKIIRSFREISVYESESNKPLHYQIVNSAKDGSVKELIILTDFRAGETKSITIENAETGPQTKFSKRTQAELSIREGGEWQKITKQNGSEQYEYIGGTFKNIDYLRVPEQHTDHSFFIRYEGPGWESDKVGYRFYLDWRNATDIFGKKVAGPVLQNVGQDGFDSYHEPSDWGMDILKVGNSLGIGSIGYWTGTMAQRVAETDSITCRINENGEIRSKILTTYYGWKIDDQKTDLKSKISIVAGSYLSKQDIFLSHQLDNLCTGIVKHDSTEVLASGDDGDWHYLATWGRQSLNNDLLGMAVFYKVADLIEITEDEDSHVIVLVPDSKDLTYYFSAVWEEDPSQIKTIVAFREYLQHERNRLNSPLKQTYKHD